MPFNTEFPCWHGHSPPSEFSSVRLSNYHYYTWEIFGHFLAKGDDKKGSSHSLKSAKGDEHQATHVQFLPLEIFYIWELSGGELNPGCDAVDN